MNNNTNCNQLLAIIAVQFSKLRNRLTLYGYI